EGDSAVEREMRRLDRERIRNAEDNGQRLPRHRRDRGPPLGGDGAEQHRGDQQEPPGFQGSTPSSLSISAASKTLPFFTIVRTFRTSLMFVVGSPSTMAKSAIFPTSTEPVSFS